jgi:hypothetical protein
VWIAQRNVHHYKAPERYDNSLGLYIAIFRKPYFITCSALGSQQECEQKGHSPCQKSRVRIAGWRSPIILTGAPPSAFPVPTSASSFAALRGVWGGNRAEPCASHAAVRRRREEPSDRARISMVHCRIVHHTSGL